MLEKGVVRYWTRRKYSDAAILALIYFLEDFLVDGLGDFVSHEALPLKQPVRANHVPVVFALDVSFFTLVALRLLPIQLEIKDNLFFYFSSELEGVDFVTTHFIGSVQEVIVSL